MQAEVENAMTAHKKTALLIIDAVRDAYPIGSVVDVCIGRSTFPARIELHSGAWWSNPGEMVGTNLHTGKTRRFTPRAIIDA